MRIRNGDFKPLTPVSCPWESGRQAELSCEIPNFREIGVGTTWPNADLIGAGKNRQCESKVTATWRDLGFGPSGKPKVV